MLWVGLQFLTLAIPGHTHLHLTLFQALENIKHIQVGKYHKSDEITRDTLELDPVRILHQAVDNGKPLLITKKLSKGSATFRVCIFIHSLFFKKQRGYCNHPCPSFCLSVMLSPPKPLDEILPNLVCELLT